MRMNDYQVLFSVAELARLCGVKPTTVRRWRTDGLGGAKLIPYDADETSETDDRSGSFLLFDVATVQNFVQKNPRVMTPALRRALEDAASPQPSSDSEAPSCSGTYSSVHEEAAPYMEDRNQYYYSLLCSREAELLKELEYVRREKEALTSERTHL